MTSRASVLVIACATLITATSSQLRVQVAKDKSLFDRVTAAKRQTDEEGRVWIGYAIHRLMERNTHISTGWMSNGPNRRTTTLDDVLYRAGDPEAFPSQRNESKVFRDYERVDKRVAVLVRYFGGKPDRVEFQTADATYDSSRTLFIWIGTAEDDESARYLIGLFKETSERKVLEHIVTAAGLHDDAGELVGPFLREVLRGPLDAKIRRSAARSLGEQPSRESLMALASAARTAKEEDVQRDAVWALASIEVEGAVDTLIAFARYGSTSKLRRTAVTAVAQRAAEQVVDILSSVVDNDPDSDVRRSAVWGLAQLKDGAGLTQLIALAKTHPNPTVRKEAVYALGNSKDDRALQALIELVRK